MNDFTDLDDSTVDPIQAEVNEVRSEDLDGLLNKHFAGRVVRKDLTKQLKEGANVPVYVLEYLLGMYCASDDDEVVGTGLENVKRILTENYVRPDESEKIKSLIRERGNYRIIDKVTVKLNQKKDVYEAILSNLGIKDALISTNLVKENEKLLTGGIWCIITVNYFFEEGQKTSPFSINTLKPIQMPSMNMDEIFTARQSFSVGQWMDVLLRSVGMEPTNLETRAKWHLLNRMVPFVENNYNVCELGPRGTGKSHVYKECSPNSLLVSGGQTTVANLFYNMSSRQVGLVGMWDVVAFDEVAGITFKDKDGVQIMKDYMASGSFSRGRDSIEGKASMVFIGNINHSVETLVKTSHLLAPFPEAMIDTAFFDRFHAYIPGWEIPKMRPEFFTDRYGLITALSRRTAIAVGGGGDRRVLQAFQAQLADMEFRFGDSAQWQGQHLIKIAIVDVALPVDAEGVQAHQVVKVVDDLGHGGGRHVVRGWLRGCGGDVDRRLIRAIAVVDAHRKPLSGPLLPYPDGFVVR